MVTRNDWTPIVLLIVLGLVGACAFGGILNGGEFLNPTAARQQASETALFAQIAAAPTQAAIQATMNAQAATQSHENRVAQMTEMPAILQQEAANQRATQVDRDFQAVEDARRRAQEQQRFNDRVSAAAQYGAFAAVLFAMVLLTFLFREVGRWIRADALYKESEAQARLLAEQRRMEEAKAALAQRPAFQLKNGNGVMKAPSANKAADGQNVKTPEYNK